MTSILISKLKTNTYPPKRLVTYKIPVFNTLNVSFDTPVSVVPLPLQDTTQTILTKIMGNTSTITLNWTLKNESSNVLQIDGALTGDDAIFSNMSTKTIFEQLNFWNAIQPKNLNDVYSFEIADSLSGQTTTPSTPYYQQIGFIQKIDFSSNSLSPVTMTGDLTFIVGNVITAGFEADVPSEPRSLVLTTPSAGQINVAWTAPVNDGGGITDYQVRYRNQAVGYDGDNGGVAVGSSTTNKTITGLTSGFFYTFKVMAKSANGYGIYSVEATKQAT